MNDKALIEARNASRLAENAAATELKVKFKEHLEPTANVRKAVAGYERYARTGKNTQETYLAFREMFSETKGKSHAVISDLIGKYIDKADYSHLSTMFDVSESDALVRDGVAALERDGYFETKLVLPPAVLESLKSQVVDRMVMAHGDAAVKDSMNGKDDALLQIKLGSAPMTLVDEMYRIAADPILLRIVQDYFGVPPIYTNPVAFLSSFREIKKDRELSDTAQLYHHDMRKLKFVKMFVYLTDVDAVSGPHTLISGTHRDRPDALWADGRHTDEAIAEAGLKDREVHIEGPAGTVFLVDTSALHKGANPISKSRIMAQIQYANTLFGFPFSDSQRRIETLRRKGDNAQTPLKRGAKLTRHYAEEVGIRFMQNFI